MPRHYSMHSPYLSNVGTTGPQLNHTAKLYLPGARQQAKASVDNFRWACSCWRERSLYRGTVQQMPHEDTTSDTGSHILPDAKTKADNPAAQCTWRGGCGARDELNQSVRETHEDTRSNMPLPGKERQCFINKPMVGP